MICIIYFKWNLQKNKLGVDWQGSTIRFCIHWPVGPVDFKSYWPPIKLLARTFLQEYTFILIKQLICTIKYICLYIEH